MDSAWIAVDNVKKKEDEKLDIHFHLTKNLKKTVKRERKSNTDHSFGLGTISKNHEKRFEELKMKEESKPSRP